MNPFEFDRESGDLSNRSLNIAEVVCSIGFWSASSGTPLMRILWHRPRLSKSSKWRCISITCERCISEDFCTCLMASVCLAVTCSTLPILAATACISVLSSVFSSVIAADRAADNDDLMSAATAWRSERHKLCAGCVAVLCPPSIMGQELPSGMDGCDEAKAMRPSPCDDRNIAGIVFGGCADICGLQAVGELLSPFPMLDRLIGGPVAEICCFYVRESSAIRPSWTGIRPRLHSFCMWI